MKKQSYKYGGSAINQSLPTQSSAKETVQVDEQFFQEQNKEQYESLKKLRKTRVDQQKLKDVSDKAFQIIENRDKVGLIRFLDQNSSIPLVDIVDHRGYTLLHMACFKNLEDIGVRLLERA